MEIAEIKKILKESSRDDWTRKEELNSCIYNKDVNLRIESDCDSAEIFSESWANALPDSAAKAVVYTVWYRETQIEKKTLVSVDGARCDLPMPKSTADLVVDKASVNFAHIVNIIDTVDEYLEKCGLSVAREDA